MILFSIFFLFVCAFTWAGNITVNTLDHAGNSISGVFKIWHGPNYLGQWNGGETVTLTDGNTYKIKAMYKSTSTSQSHTVSGDAIIDFKTTKVTLHFAGAYCNYQGSGSWKPFNRPSMELFPKDAYGNTMKFQFGKVWNDKRYMYKTIDYAGEESIEKTITILQLLGHDGTPISGGKAKGGYTSPTLWYVAGSTNAEGLLMDCRDGNPSQLVYQMSLHNGSQTVGPQDPSANSYYDFETELVTLRLEKCDGTPLDDGHPRYGNGSSYWTSHWPNGNTGWSNPGETTAEMFQGTYSFDMQYQGTSEQKVSQTVPDGGATFTWQTTEVTLSYAGTISYGGSGNARFFNQPTMDLLPGTYTFNFRGVNGGYYKDLTFSGCTFGGNVYIFKVKDEAGDGIAGVPIEWHYNTNYGNTYKLLGSTDANGELLSIGDVTKTGNQPFRAEYNKTTQRKYTSNYLEFQTIVATALVENCEQGPISGVDIDFLWHPNYSGNNWRIDVGTTDSNGEASIELFPGNHKFEAKINHTKSVKTFDLDPGNAVDVEFNPTLVNLNYSGSVKWKYNNYYYTDVTPDYLMFPGTYLFKFDQHHKTLAVSGCTFGGNVYIFKVKDEAGAAIADVPIEWHYNTNYGNTYTLIGETDANGKLFSIGDVTKTGNQPFRAKYNQTYQRKLTTNYLEFQTAVATALVQNCEQGPISGVDIDFLWHPNYTGNNWRIDVGTTGNDGTASIELFPGNHKFEAKINYTKSVKTFDLDPNVAVDVEFNPTQVNLSYPGTVEWKYNNYYYTVVLPDYLMFPGTYNFKFIGSNGNIYRDLAITGCSFEKSYVYLTVMDEYGNGVPGAKFEPACGGSWQPLLTGSTNANGHLFAEIPSCMTKIRAMVNQTSQQQSAAELLASNYTYTTELLRINLLDHAGAAITDQTGTLEQGGGHWYNWGNFNSSGYIEVPAFSGNNVKFSATYNCTSDTKAGIPVAAGAGTQNIDFQTGQVISSCGHTQYQGCGWSTFTSGMELMPGTRTYRYPDITAALAAGTVLDLCAADNGSGPGNLSHKSAGIPTDGINLYPNPIRENSTATLQYNLDKTSRIQVTVYNSIGVRISNLEDAVRDEGNYTIKWSTTNINPGVYYFRIVIDNKHQYLKELIVK